MCGRGLSKIIPLPVDRERGKSKLGCSLIVVMK
jgi:hypothetical protein